MKDKIHPDYHEVDAHCACGNIFKTRTTAKSIGVDICGVCHPFYTGKQKLMDAAGRVEKFHRKFGADYFAKSKAPAGPAKK